MGILKKFGLAVGLGAKKERPPRVHINPRHNIFFRSADLSEEQIKISNVSVSGVAILSDSKFTERKEGETIQGFLHINGRDYRTSVKIIHATDQLIGCQFVTPPGEMVMAIINYFNVEIAALKLKKVEDGNDFTFRNGEDEIFIKLCNEALEMFRIRYLGHHIEGDSQKVTKYGTMAGDDAGAPTLLETGDHVPDDVADGAIKLIQNIKALPDPIREELEFILYKSKKAA